MQQWRDSVESSIQEQQNGLGLFRTFPHGRLVGLVNVQLLLYHLGKLSVALVVTEIL